MELPRVASRSVPASRGAVSSKGRETLVLSGKRLREDDGGVVKAWVRVRRRGRRVEGICMFRREWGEIG